jgi:AcrR family transcriptional regulator
MPEGDELEVTVNTVPQPLREKNRLAARDAVLDAAERLLARGDAADFSMRALAAEAGVGFATPFNHFGSKNAIMQALSARLIARMAARFKDASPPGDAIDRVLAMGRIAVALLLEQPAVYRMVVGSLGVVSPVPSSVRTQSQALWALALGDYAGIAAEVSEAARIVLPQQFAFAFRGGLSFWIAGELPDDDLRAAFETGAATILLGFAAGNRRADLMTRIKGG